MRTLTLLIKPPLRVTYTLYPLLYIDPSFPCWSISPSVAWGSSLKSLAQHYQAKSDPKTGVYFHEKCLEISRLTNDKKGEMAANHRLGLVYDELVSEGDRVKLFVSLPLRGVGGGL